MQMRNHFIFMTLMFVLFAKVGVSQEKEKRNFFSYFGMTPVDDTLRQEKTGLMFAPILFYTPDTRWSAGAAGLSAFRLKGKTDSIADTRMSYLKFLGIYTLNKQFDSEMSWNVFTPRERYLFKGEVRFRSFPDRFYGIGNQTIEANKEMYAYNLFRFNTLFLKKFGKNFFAGLDYEFEKEYNFNYQENGVLESGSVFGYNGGLGSAIGIVALHDNRDNILNAYSGWYGELSSYYFTRWLGSTFTFLKINGNLKKFVELQPRHVLAFQLKTRSTFGQTPFLDMATLGGDDILRGYASNRFRDHHFFATQLEYRFPLFWRFGMVAFAGGGDVFSRPQDLSWRNMKYAGGIGFRFLVNAAERINGRIDFSYGAEGFNFYFGVSEAF
jgi:outer membrane protein assembly factor BamA